MLIQRRDATVTNPITSVRLGKYQEEWQHRPSSKKTSRDTWQVMTSWHVVTLVTFHDMLWHLHEPPRHDMKVMSRRLMPAQGSEPETLWCRNGFRIQSDAFLGSSLIYILDPIWCIAFWIRSDIHHTLHFLIQLSQHTRTHRGEGGFEWSSDVKSCFAGIHPTVLLWPRKLKLWGEYPPSYHQQIFQNLAMLSFLRRHMHKLHSDDDCIKFGLSSYCAADHPPYILGSNSTD